MKKTATYILQVCIVITGIAVLIFLIRFPLTEGRAANLDLFSIYTDPFILSGYAIAIVFFTGLYKIYRLLSLARREQVFSSTGAGLLKSIKYCGIILALAILLAGMYIRLFHHKDDDPAGFMGLCAVSFLFFIVATIFSSRLEKKVNRIISTGSVDINS